MVKNAISLGLLLAAVVAATPTALGQDAAKGPASRQGAKQEPDAKASDTQPANTKAKADGGDPKDAAKLERIALDARVLLTTRCSECHGTESTSEFVIFDRDAVLQHIKGPNPRSTSLFDMLYTEKMPKTGNKLTLGELRLVEEWIKAGAPFPPDKEPQPISELDLCQAIQKDLEAVARRDKLDAPHQRYLTLVHLHNNPQITAQEMRLYRAALSKLLNSLSRKREIKVPLAVDPPQETIFRIDLRNYGWTASDWTEVLKKYPYGIEYRNKAVRDAHERIQDLFTADAANPIAYVRGDWFVARASLPDLYHRLLNLPDTVAKLEEELKVNVADNLKQARDVARAGFYQSGVSVNNRLVERHVMPFGAYWKSYDFKGSSREKNLFLHPLGPAIDALAPFKSFAFQHDGGEMIWNLPNGLQAYFLADAEGKRINAGPVEVVRDRLESAGNPVVVNGLSCIACHDQGMNRFKDAVRDGFKNAVLAAEDKVQRLYPPNKDMDELLAEDELRFKQAVFSATKVFLGLKTPDEVFDHPEPVSKLAQRYNADLTLKDVMLELGLSDAKRELLLVTGLPLGSLRERPIKREFWESRLRGKSVFQEAAVKTEIASGTIVVD